MPAFYSQLDNESLLQVSGPDAATFLQGQLTCDVRAIDAAHAAPGAWCNAQGRIIADLLLVQCTTDQYLLRLRADIAASTATRLGKYVVFSKASVERLENWRVFALWGDELAEALGSLFPDLPEGRFGSVSGEGLSLVQMDEAGQQFELYASPERGDISAGLSSLEAADSSQWQALQIASGLGRIEAETVEEFLPQALNFDLEGFVSFQKGCYTGQEVIARLHYRGKSKRRAFIGRVDCASAPGAGAPVFQQGASQAVGNVVNAVGSPDQGCTLLLSTTLKACRETLYLAPDGGPAITLTVPAELVGDSDPETDGN
ncbi:folate-binding protein YgfZ [Parahaliea maris]|uniref:Folate-binding protein YgfZ n=1 Tax=Parahaliea maris TaxID=2716870 RepID=A0A5C9A3P7_9GAMM|nr:folate-binding protein YgfZ [Parahaliea maris]TXS95503.1 folate-binding protein YgfZ [Parahaliea maris]